MSQTLDAGVRPPPPAADERVARRSLLSRLLTRPEVGALLGAIVIYIVFFAVAPPFRDATSLSTVLYVSSTYGIPAVAVALLMIGGEFDLSAGVIVTSAGLFNAMLSYQLGLNLWVGAAASLAFALAIGFLNGYLVMRTGIASFLITLGTFDFNPQIPPKIKSGELQWAIDQQPYLQGYLSIDSLWLYKANGNVLGGGKPTLTGPFLVDNKNIDFVGKFAAGGTR